MRLPCPSRLRAWAPFLVSGVLSGPVLIGCEGAPMDEAPVSPVASTASNPTATNPATSTPSTPTALPETGPPETEPPPTETPPPAPATDTTVPAEPPSGSGPRLGLVGIEPAGGGTPGGATSTLGTAPTPIVHATAVDIGDGVRMDRLLALLVPDDDRCEPVSNDLDAPIAPLAAAGFAGSLIIDGPAGTWATLSRTSSGDMTLYRSPEQDIGALPAGATMSISGDSREFATNFLLPAEPPAPSVTANRSGDGAILLSWSPVRTGQAGLLGQPDVAPGTDRLSLDLTVGERAWRCELVDDGIATLDEMLPPAPGAVRVISGARIRQTTVVLEAGGDALLIRHRRAAVIVP